ncbi:unnamed protein product, partial [Sphagnum jensenii]
MQKSKAVYLDWVTSGFPSRRCRQTTLQGCTYPVWKICSKKEIACFGWNIADIEPVSSVGGYGETRQE